MHRRHRLDVLAVELVRLEDRFLVPVGPVHVILERGDRERMPQVVGRVEHHGPFGSVVVTGGNHVQLGVHLSKKFDVNNVLSKV